MGKTMPEVGGKTFAAGSFQGFARSGSSQGTNMNNAAYGDAVMPPWSPLISGRP